MQFNVFRRLRSPAGGIDKCLSRAEDAGRSGDIGEAIAQYSLTIELYGDDARAYYKRGNLLKDHGQLEEALEDYDRSVALNPGYAHAFCNRGVVLARLNRLDAAVSSYDQAVTLNPMDTLAYFNRGAVLRELKRPQEALKSYDRAIEINPHYAECLYNRSLLLLELAQWSAALTSLDAAIAARPDFARGHCQRGNVLVELKRNESALDSFDRAIALDPDAPDAHHNRANVLLQMKRFPQALAGFDRAIELHPRHVEAFIGRGLCQQNLREFEAAIASYDKALTINPDQRYLLGMRRHAQMQICDWADLKVDLERLQRELRLGCPISTPHAMLALVDSPALHRLAAEAWVREECPPNDSMSPIPARARGDKIRVGYFSADFRDHPVALLTAELFETHDRSNFEIIGFAFGPNSGDAMRARMEKAFDRFIDASGLSDVEVVTTARALGVDIAVDLGGYTENARTKIFALRAAPLQINYLGYPGTMGASYMDYMIGDPTVVPEALQVRCVEKIVYLPNSYLPNDSTRIVADISQTRVELGLAATGFVFCCFNSSYKINPEMFLSWMRILSRVESSVLWLSSNNHAAEKNLRNQAVQSGINTNRLVFAERLASLPEHLARYRSADLFLDTLPYNAHATAIDALWAGVPLLTRMGESFASRAGASLLKSLGLPELVTSTAQEYEDMAVQLATDPLLHREIRRKLERKRLDGAMFDTGMLTRQLEAAYCEMFRRYHAGLRPEHIFVGRSSITEMA